MKFSLRNLLLFVLLLNLLLGGYALNRWWKSRFVHHINVEYEYPMFPDPRNGPVLPLEMQIIYDDATIKELESKSSSPKPWEPLAAKLVDAEFAKHFLNAPPIERSEEELKAAIARLIANEPNDASLSVRKQNQILLDVAFGDRTKFEQIVDQLDTDPYDIEEMNTFVVPLFMVAPPSLVYSEKTKEKLSELFDSDEERKLHAARLCGENQIGGFEDRVIERHKTFASMKALDDSVDNRHAFVWLDAYKRVLQQFGNSQATFDYVVSIIPVETEQGRHTELNAFVSSANAEIAGAAVQSLKDRGYDPGSTMYRFANPGSLSVRSLTSADQLTQRHRELLARHAWPTSVTMDDVHRFSIYRSNYYSRSYGELNLACCRANGLLFDFSDYAETNIFFNRLNELTEGEVNIVYDRTEVGSGLYVNSFLINEKIYRYESPHSMPLSKPELAVITNSILKRERISKRLTVLAEPGAMNLASPYVLFAEPAELDWLKENFGFTFVGNMPDF